MVSKLFSVAERFKIKLADKDIKVYTFVPNNAIASIRQKGILSAAELIKDKGALEKSKPKNQESFIKSTKQKLDNPEWEDIVNGISVLFTLPDWEVLPKKHFIFKNNLVPIIIDLSKFIKDNPKTKLLGLELTPLLVDYREKYLSIQDVEQYCSKSPKELWKEYKGQVDKYAPDVPHLVIVTGNISPKYIIM